MIRPAPLPVKAAQPSAGPLHIGSLTARNALPEAQRAAGHSTASVLLPGQSAALGGPSEPRERPLPEPRQWDGITRSGCVYAEKCNPAN